jgi:hypothetical protein
LATSVHQRSACAFRSSKLAKDLPGRKFPSAQAKGLSIHPLLGKVFALVDRRRTWGEDRVYYHDEAGKLCRMNAQWTSAAEADLFVLTSAGRSSLRVSDLLVLAGLIEQHRAAVKACKPCRRGSASSRK